MGKVSTAERRRWMEEQEGNVTREASDRSTSPERLEEIALYATANAAGRVASNPSASHEALWLLWGAGYH